MVIRFIFVSIVLLVLILVVMVLSVTRNAYHSDGSSKVLQSDFWELLRLVSRAGKGKADCSELLSPTDPVFFGFGSWGDFEATA